MFNSVYELLYNFEPSKQNGLLFCYNHRWAGGGMGGEYPLPDVQKTAPPQANNLFTTVPPSNWLAAGGCRKLNTFLFKIAKILPPFGGYQQNFQVLSFIPPPPPCPPSERRNLSPSPGGPKTTPHPAKILLIPLPVADPTPTYGYNILFLNV